MSKIRIGEHGKVCIKWNVLPVDYSHEREKELKSKVAKKYGISRHNVTIDPIYIKKTTDGKTMPFDGGVSQNVHDPKFQQSMFHEWLELNGITDYNWDKLIEIDESINGRIDYDKYKNHKRYTIKWIKWSNFMSYGKDNYFDFTKINGLTLLTSVPANQGGKTTFCLDLFRFLLFGKVTSRENGWTLAKVFNDFIPDATECSVEGCVEIDGIDYVIKRVVTRPKLDKRTDRSKVTQKISYYKLINDEYISLEDEENNAESDGRLTNKAIKEAIGNESDFDLMMCVSSDNLKSLISLKDTDRGRLISRWVGLMPLEEKDKLARDTYNQDVAPKLLSNRYNKTDLTAKIEELQEENKKSTAAQDDLKKRESESTKKLEELKATRDTLLQSKILIDETLMKVDVQTVANKIDTLTESGKRKRAEKEANEKKLEEMGELTFSEDEYKTVEKRCTELNVSIATKREQLKALKLSVEALEKGEFCPTCGAKLKGVDNTEAIKDKKIEIEKLIEEGKAEALELKEKTTLKDDLTIKRKEYNDKLKLKLIIEKNTVDIENIISQYREAKRLMSDIEKNKTAIETNNKIELSLTNIAVNVRTEEQALKLLQQRMVEEQQLVMYNYKVIKESAEIIKILESEEVLVKSWKIYLEMVGKHGISKLVIRNVLPFINNELRHLLDDVCDFYVEVAIDDRNDVAFYLIKDDRRANLGSGSGFEQTVASLALRSVLSKISTFSKPSFVVFDEILGAVAEDNLDKIKLLYDKIAKDYSTILEISHLKSIFDWHTHFITIKKDNDISSIELS